jgi:hypothetical protein
MYTGTVLARAYAISQLPSFCEFTVVPYAFACVKGIVTRDEFFFKAYNDKKVLSVHALIKFLQFFVT